MQNKYQRNKRGVQWLISPTKVAGTLRRAVRGSELTRIPGERHMDCAYYFDFCRLCLGRINFV